MDIPAANRRLHTALVIICLRTARLPGGTKALNDAASNLPKGPLKDVERNAFFMAYENLRKQIETPIDAVVRVLFGVS